MLPTICHQFLHSREDDHAVEARESYKAVTEDNRRVRREGKRKPKKKQELLTNESREEESIFSVSSTVAATDDFHSPLSYFMYLLFTSVDLFVSR